MPIQKQKLPLLERLLLRETDEDHGLTLEETVTAVLRSLPPHAPFISRAKV